jgi:hypothetical protein
MIFRVLETALGMAVVYLLMCLFVSALNEWIAHARGTRGKFLLKGLRRLVPDQPIYRRVAQHPLISALYRDKIAVGRPPSYIEPENFAKALVDVIRTRAALVDSAFAKGPFTGAELKGALQVIATDHPLLTQAIIPVVERANGDYAKALAEIEHWFSAGMDRVSGWYKAHTRKWLFVLGLICAVLGNVDSINLAQSFWSSPGLRAAAADLANDISRSPPPGTVSTASAASEIRDQDSARRLIELQEAGLPIGFDCLANSVEDWSIFTECGNAALGEMRKNGLLKVIGWLFTGLAVSLGAPFWFDVVSRYVSVRQSGNRPGRG